jgi:hypothetical protein
MGVGGVVVYYRDHRGNIAEEWLDKTISIIP